MSRALKTRNVFLTGGAQGIGKSLTEGLLEAGARVVFGDVNATAGATTEKEFGDKYGRDRIRFVQFDVTDGLQFTKAFQSAVDHLGYVDLMVNNAGILNEDLWEKKIQINFASTVRGTLLAYEHMRKDKGGRGGRIINVCSETGLQDYVLIPVYCGTKHAVRAFTSSMAAAPDVSQLGIEFGLLCPGPTKTNMMRTKPSALRHSDSFVSTGLPMKVGRIQTAFMKLALLEDMNGAILEVQSDYVSFVRMEKRVLGENWPIRGSPAWRSWTLKSKL